MRFNNTKIIYSALYLVSILLSACNSGGGGGGTTSHTVGGSVSGLTGTVVLQDNGGDNLTVSANGTFTFATKVASGKAYNITVLTQPIGQTCIVTGGTGTVSGKVSNVAVSCTNNSYTVGGLVSGLTGSVVLQDNGGDNLTVPANGTFTFATKVANGNTYNVTVLTQPAGQTCTASTGVGTISGGNVTNVAVVCSSLTYSVGGTVSGLVGSMVLQDNNGDNLTVAANGVFTFAAQVANGSPYSVTVLTHPVGQSCSVASGTGTIALANVTNVAITCAINTHTIGGTVTGLNGSMVLQDNGGDNLTVAVNGSFTFATSVTNGNTYIVTVLTQPITGQTCTITGGSGTATANVTTVAANCVSRFAYVANFGTNDVSAYTIDASGALIALTDVDDGTVGNQATIAAGTGPHSVTVDPSGEFAYVANWSSNDVSAYAINASTGALTQVLCGGVLPICNGDNFKSGPLPFSVTVTVTPSGKFAYVPNFGTNDVSAYAINTSTGALTSVGAVVAAGTNPSSITVDPAGNFAYVANQGTNDVSAYSINASGALTQILCGGVLPICNGDNFKSGTNPVSVTVTVNPSGSGKFAYVANYGTNDVSAYSINASGALIALADVDNSTVGNQATIAAGINPSSVTVDPAGNFAYVANKGSNDVSAYTINASGALTPIICSGTCRGNNFPAGTNPISVTVNPSGKFAYVTNWGSADVSAYTIDAGGALTQVLCGGVLPICNGDNFKSGTNPISVTTTGTIQ